jgi:hypothetical protein
VGPAIKQLLEEEGAALDLLEADLQAAGKDVEYERVFRPYGQIRYRLDGTFGLIDNLQVRVQQRQQQEEEGAQCVRSSWCQCQSAHTLPSLAPQRTPSLSSTPPNHPHMHNHPLPPSPPKQPHHSTQGLMDSPDLRKAVEASQPERVAFELRLSQSKPVYNAVMTLRNTPALYDKLTREQKRIVDINVKDFKTSGVGLDPVKRREYNAIVDELAKLGTNFTNNVQDATAVSSCCKTQQQQRQRQQQRRLCHADGRATAHSKCVAPSAAAGLTLSHSVASTRQLLRLVLILITCLLTDILVSYVSPSHPLLSQAFKYLVRDKKELEGLEATTLAVAAQKAADAGHKGATAEAGPWLLTLDYTTYSAVVSFANNRALREKVYKAYRAIGAEGKTDNTDIIRQIIAKRQQLARMLGFKNYAEESFLGKVSVRGCGRGCTLGGGGWGGKVGGRTAACQKAEHHSLHGPAADSNATLLPDLPRPLSCCSPLCAAPVNPSHQMATMQQAEALMNELTTVARPVSITEDTALRAFARNATGDSALQLKWWDNAYWAERQKEAKFRVLQEELRQYLPLPSVKAGLWKVRGKGGGGQGV